MTNIDKLIAAVEAGKWPPVHISGGGVGDYVGTIKGPWSATDWFLAKDACDGSLDAAHRLHEALLPGWGWCAATDAHSEQWFCVDDPSGSFETEETYAATPARAWLLAILRALKARA